jgi:hypothetical protein
VTAGTQTLDRAWQDLKKYVPSEITAKDATSKKVNPACGIGFTAGCGAATVKEMCGQPCQLCFTETEIAASQLPKRPAPLTAA